MTARHTFSMGIDDAELMLISPEAAPLDIFGPTASDAVAALLSDAAVAFHPNAYASLAGGGEITLMPAGEHLRVDRIVSLPLLEGPRLAGVPSDDQGFIPVDVHGVVADHPDVYAAGDATNYAVKQGGLACQQADAVAEHIAARAGAPVDPQPFQPVLRGKLLTGAGAQYLHGGAGASTTSTLKLWSTSSKVAGRYLGPWLAGDDDVPDAVVEEIEIEVEEPLSPEWRVGYNPMGLDSLGVINPRGRHFASYGPFGR
jgi:sulfide:quinone oxidoreductase